MTDQAYTIATIRRLALSISDEYKGLPEVLVTATIQQWARDFAAELQEIGKIARRALQYFKDTRDLPGTRTGVGSDILFNVSMKCLVLINHVPELNRMLFQTENDDFLQAMRELDRAFPEVD